MSRYLTDMADVLRAAGCNVVEQAGWQTRARSSGGYADGRPWCVMWHHTASAPGTSAASNVSYIISGSPDAPIANLYLHNDGTFYVCAAGATNTNGKGGPTPFSKGTVPLDSMNTYAIGIEAGNSGVGEAYPQAMIDAYFKGSNALAAAYGLQPTDLCSHAEYAPTRKIDPATAAAVQGPWQPRSINSNGTWNVDDIKAEAQNRATPGPGPIPLPPVTEVSEMLTMFLVDDGRVPVALYVTNGVWYRHIPDESSRDALVLFMTKAGLDTTQNHIKKYQVGFAGAYIGDDGSLGAANPFL